MSRRRGADRLGADRPGADRPAAAQELGRELGLTPILAPILALTLALTCPVVTAARAQSAGEAEGADPAPQSAAAAPAQQPAAAEPPASSDPARPADRKIVERAADRKIVERAADREIVERSADAAPAPQPAAGEVLFRNVVGEWGIDFTHHSAPEKKYIVESMSGGVALFDFDGDGRLDVYLVDSLTVATAGDPSRSRSALYRNLGGGRFEDVADRAGVAHPGWGMGACVADYDGDARPDLYVTALGANHLYRNLGDGRFADVTAQAGVAGGGWSAGCGFADYDRDGDLDLFVSRYVEIVLAKLPEFGKDKTCRYRGVAVQCGPRGLPGSGDLLYRNDGGGRFTEVGAHAGVADADGYFGLGIAWVDVDADGWLDLFVADDSTPNLLYLNRRDGTFAESAFPMGVAVSEDGAEQGGMGVAVGDYDGSGRPSLFETNFAEEYNALYRNDGEYFTDVSFKSGVAAASLPFVGWGTAFFDYDNDGWLDLIVTDGHVYPQLENAKLGASAPYRQRRLLYRNRGNGSFEEVAERYGEVLGEPRVGRGLAVGDLDDDGRLDVVINDLDGPPQVLHNVFAAAGHWLRVELRGRAPNTAGIGATVKLTAAGRTQTRTVRSGTSYLSQDDLRQHFGLGAATKVERLIVVWPDGSTSERTGLEADRDVVIEQPAAAKKSEEDSAKEKTTPTSSAAAVSEPRVPPTPSPAARRPEPAQTPPPPGAPRRAPAATAPGRRGI